MPRYLVNRVPEASAPSAPFRIPDLQQSFRSSFGFLRCDFGTILVQLQLLLFLVGIHPCHFHGINFFLGFGRVGNFREEPNALFAEEEVVGGEGTAGHVGGSFAPPSESVPDISSPILYNYSTRAGTVGLSRRDTTTANHPCRRTRW